MGACAQEMTDMTIFDEVRRIYVATSTKNRELAGELKAELRADHRYEVTHDWTGHDHIFDETLDTAVGETERRRAAAEADLRGVRTADLLIYLSHEKCFGANIELGGALILGIEVWVVGPIARDSIFFDLENVTVYGSIDAVRADLGVLQVGV